MKRGIINTILALVLAALVAAPAAAQEKEGVAITVYNSNMAVVKEKRLISLNNGTSQVKFKDVAKRIDATSVHFKSLTDPDGTYVMEQNYDFDLVSASKLLEKYIDQDVRIMTEDGKEYAGVLLSFDSAQIVLKNRDGKLTMIHRPDNIKDIRFPSLPAGLLTRPTLVWKVNAKKGGRHMTKVTYITGGVSWRTDYTVVTDKEDAKIDLAGWVTITNHSGATYKDAKIKLIAGDVHRASRPRSRGRWGKSGLREDRGFLSSSFSEYHMYTLQRPSTLKDNQVKQIELLNKTGVPVEKYYRYYGGKKVKVYLEFMNDKKSNLGIALPMGKVRVYKRDEADKSLEFIGEDNVDHTPRDERVKLYIGNAFDVVGERKRVDFKKLWGDAYEETIEVEIRNHKDKGVTVEVYERLHGYKNYEIKEKNHDFEKKDATTLMFPVKLEADGKFKIKYRIMYWN